MTEIVLGKYLIDVVRAAPDNQVQMVTYLVVGADPNDALERYMSGDVATDNIFYEGDTVNNVIIGITAANDAVIDVTSKDNDAL